MRSTFPSASYPACGDDRMYDLHHGLPALERTAAFPDSQVMKLQGSPAPQLDLARMPPVYSHPAHPPVFRQNPEGIRNLKLARRTGRFPQLAHS